MNPEVKRMWVDALRSGNYRQDQWVLRRNVPSDKPVCCALGVLCEIAVNAGVVERYCPDDRSLVMYGDGRAMKTLPREVMQWAGVRSSEVMLEDQDGGEVSVSCLNDHENMSFEQIATIIEEQL
jgi:hypothetical protein